MEWQLTAEQRLVRDSVRAFAEREISPYIREWDRSHAHDPALFGKMAEAGLLGICLPVALGGSGLDYLSLGLACEELERADTFARVVLSVHVGLNSLSLFQWATEEQKQRLLVPQALGDKLAAFALTEPNAGSDVAAMQSYAVRDGDAYRLYGEKTWISLACVADHILVFAKTDREAGHRGITAFLLEKGAAGLSTFAIEGKMGIRAGNTGRVVMDGAVVPMENRIGEEGDGFKIAMSALDKGRFTVASGAIGTVVAALEASLAYAEQRKTFGKPIAEHQLVQQMIARMVQNRDIGRALYYDLGRRMNAGLRSTREASMAKWTNCDASFQAAHDAVEIHGAYGYSDEFPVERLLRNARGPMIYEGTREIHQIVQAEYALGKRVDSPYSPMLPSWPFDE